MTKTIKRIDDQYLVLFDELEEECNNYIRLLKEFKDKNLAQDEYDEKLGEISASMIHLSAHAGNLNDQVMGDDDEGEDLAALGANLENRIRNFYDS